MGRPCGSKAGSCGGPVSFPTGGLPHSRLLSRHLLSSQAESRSRAHHTLSVCAVGPRQRSGCLEPFDLVPLTRWASSGSPRMRLSLAPPKVTSAVCTLWRGPSCFSELLGMEAELETACSSCFFLAVVSGDASQATSPPGMVLLGPGFATKIVVLTSLITPIPLVFLCNV